MASLALDQGLKVLDRHARIARWFLIAFMIVSLLTIFVSFGEVAGSIDLNRQELSPTDMVGGLIYAVYALVLFVSILWVCIWIYRAHANLRAVGFEGLTYSPGWAVGWYFIPFANLFKPYEAMQELWATSTAGSAEEGTDGHLGRWWAAWIVGNILTNIGVRTESMGNGDLAPVGHAVDALGTVILIGSAWLLARIVQKVTAAQDSLLSVAGVFD